MGSALIKKQFSEIFRGYFVNQKTGKARSKGGTIGFFLLFAGLMLMLGGVFFGAATLIGELLTVPGYGWLFFTMMGILSIALGTFGSVFNTYASLYMAKDNELLLSMPIPPSKILLARMTVVYLLSLMYSGIVWLPTVLYSWFFGAPTALAVVFDVALLALIALFVTVLTCALGWLVALIASRVRNKSIFVVFLTMLFFCGYYYVCFNMGELLGALVSNSEQTGRAIRLWANLLYRLGCGANGEVLGMAVFTAVTVALFAVCMWALSVSFTRIVTRAPAAAKTTARMKDSKHRGQRAALYRRELKHFTGSATYMLNCGLGVFFLLMACVVAVVKRDFLEMVLAEIVVGIPIFGKMLPFTVLMSVCMILSINTISVPSVSLEGKSLWIIRSLPVPGSAVLRAKRDLHLSINGAPAVVAAVVLGLCFGLEWTAVLSIAVYALVFVWFTAVVGLMFGLLRPNFRWTSEVMPIKQSLNSVFTMAIGWITCILTLVEGNFLQERLGVVACIWLATVVVALAALLLDRWLMTAGGKRFDSL